MTSDTPKSSSSRVQDQIHLQTVPVEADYDDLPPAYEPGPRRRSPPGAAAGFTSGGRVSSSSATSRDGLNAATRDSPVPNAEGYLRTDPMHWELKEQRGDWDKYENMPGCLCATSGGVLCSARGGIMCSDREGFFCSDRQGMFFSDRGGLWCGDLGAKFCSSTGGEAAQENN
ncbi:hypothetical protein LIA77_03946 [Sarocladium implicatum]|nr:hypothetical protein LIA77_03946 [Sarocladium implicatum]